MFNAMVQIHHTGDRAETDLLRDLLMDQSLAAPIDSTSNLANMLAGLVYGTQVQLMLWCHRIASRFVISLKKPM
jgi:hypothetical protein